MDNSYDESLHQLFTTLDQELLATYNRVRILIGKDHWPSGGNHAEAILRQLLRERLPRKFEVSTGFVRSWPIQSLDDELHKPKSKQLDIVVWNCQDYSPIFRSGEFVVVHPEACTAVIEVKSRTSLING